MGFIKNCLEKKEGPILPIVQTKKKRYAYTPNRSFLGFLDEEHNDPHDVAYIIRRVQSNFKKAFWLSLSIIESFRVRHIVEDTLQSIRNDFRHIPRRKKIFSQKQFRVFWRQECIVQSERMHVTRVIQEVMQRTLFEVLDVPIELNETRSEDGTIVKADLVMLWRQRYRRNNPFTTADYQ